MNPPNPIVRYLDETESLPCPYGDVRRIVTGGEGGVANVHVIRVTCGNRHFHTGYNEVYYILSGNGIVTMGEDSYAMRQGAVVVIRLCLCYGRLYQLPFKIDDVPIIPVEFNANQINILV